MYSAYYSIHLLLPRANQWSGESVHQYEIQVFKSCYLSTHPLDRLSSTSKWLVLLQGLQSRMTYCTYFVAIKADVDVHSFKAVTFFRNRNWEMINSSFRSCENTRRPIHSSSNIQTYLIESNDAICSDRQTSIPLNVEIDSRRRWHIHIQVSQSILND